MSDGHVNGVESLMGGCVRNSMVDPYRLEFTAESLPNAVRQIFILNDYEVTGPEQHHGAEVDLVARPRRDVFPEPIYIEVTVEYVDNDKFAKDCTKFMAFQAQNPKCRCLIVSSRGFSKPVIERAAAAKVQTLTYTDLLQRFEKFDPYLRSLFIDGPQHNEISTLRKTYEEPVLHDEHGTDKALEYLRQWRDRQDVARWLIIVGEYGTGKTALTKVLQYDWCLDYASDPSSPIVFRMELRDFARQFDADGLLHHFLDRNRLGDVPIRYIYQLIRSGRLVLLLDGYDEMAQYMSTRERRACLEALATLSHEGARGILTSRPNYFSEAEELTVLEALYKELATYSSFSARTIAQLAEQERKVDQLLDSHFVNRFERTLRDLTPEQTEALVRRKLAGNVAGQEVVLRILKSIFRDEGTSNLALSGKPVIITYLLEVVDSLLAGTLRAEQNLTEWSVYTLIVDNLMLRDYQRTPEISPRDRREFLRRLSVALSRRENPIIGETDFRQLVAREMKFRPGLPEEERRKEIDARFDDLRASTTLTRSGHGTDIGWRFSHNSLREFLLTEYCLTALTTGATIQERAVPISEPMRNFAASQPQETIEKQFTALAKRWNDDGNSRGIWLSLLWGEIERGMPTAGAEYVATALSTLSGGRRLGEGTTLGRLPLSSSHAPQDLRTFEFSGTELLDIGFSSADLRGAKFVGSWLDGCNFQDCDLSNCNFSRAVLSDVHLSGAKLDAAVFIGIDDASSILVAPDGVQLERLTGPAMIGYLRYYGGHTEAVDDYWIYRHHPRFSIVEKICRKLIEQATRQMRGLVQRGAAAADTTFANEFMQRLVAEEYVEHPKGRNELVTITIKGREELTRFVDGNGYLPPVITDILRQSS